MAKTNVKSSTRGIKSGMSVICKDVDTDDKLNAREYSKKIVEEASKKIFRSSELKKIFIRFMEIRFPVEASSSYVNEWAERFNRGVDYALGKMDLESKRAFHKASIEVIESTDFKKD